MKTLSANITNFYAYCLGNHTFAALNAEECYKALSDGMETTMDTINALIANPTVSIDGTPNSLETVLGGDYKVHAYLTH